MMVFWLKKLKNQVCKQTSIGVEDLTRGFLSFVPSLLKRRKIIIILVISCWISCFCFNFEM